MSINFNDIKQGFTNYVGSALSSLNLEDKEAKQLVSSMLLEESLIISKNKDNSYDLFVIKPFLRAFILIFNDRITQLKKLNLNVDNKINAYKNIIEEVEKLLNSI